MFVVKIIPAFWPMALAFIPVPTSRDYAQFTICWTPPHLMRTIVPNCTTKKKYKFTHFNQLHINAFNPTTLNTRFEYAPLHWFIAFQFVPVQLSLRWFTIHLFIILLSLQTVSSSRRQWCSGFSASQAYLYCAIQSQTCTISTSNFNFDFNRNCVCFVFILAS